MFACKSPIYRGCLLYTSQSCAEREPEMYIALYADETVPYREIVKVLNIANENKFKMVLALSLIHIFIFVYDSTGYFLFSTYRFVGLLEQQNLLVCFYFKDVYKRQ